MSDDRDSNKSVIDDNNYHVSIDGNCVHYYILEDDYKITVTVFPEGTFDSTKNSEKTKETNENKED